MASKTPWFVMKFSKHSSFNELKSDHDLLKDGGTESLAAYTLFVDLLKRSFEANNALRTTKKNKKRNEQRLA
jgi:hypothetical protein